MCDLQIENGRGGGSSRIILNEIILHTRPGRSVLSSAIVSRISTPAAPADLCFDGNVTTGCATSVGDPEPKLVAQFPCSGSGLAALKALEIFNTR